MIVLTVKNTINKKRLHMHFSNFPVYYLVLLSNDCVKADWLVYWCAPFRMKEDVKKRKRK